jgi:hypothetical protein
MDKSLALVIIRDLETSLNILAFALAEKNDILAQEALANAVLEVSTLRQMIEESSSRGGRTLRS